MFETPDGGLLLGTGTNPGTAQVYIVKFDATGNIETQLKYDVVNYEWV